MPEIGITSLVYISSSHAENIQLNYPDARVMDRYSKMTLAAAIRLYERIDGQSLDPNRWGIVLATGTGPLNSVKAFHHVLSLQGYVGINPSMFPNIMTVTALARTTIALQAKGPSIPLWHADHPIQAIRYAVLQLMKDVCDGMMVLYSDNEKRCWGLFIESEEAAAARGLTLRFPVDINEY
ncbi:hypothetical protein V3851_08775 [Paenibacillus sp. M1]|uniref:Beta-ketoacyl synthase N-terminal domain-containing protein n=1 Tax=Paenibacillus haidiansis TaxID=1574488 RepID=A0ABU7VQ89_9BACL